MSDDILLVEDVVSGGDILLVEDVVASLEILSEGFQGPVGAQGARGVSAGAVQRTVNTPIGGHRLVVSVVGQVLYADPLNIAHMGKLLGITMGAAIAGGSVEIRSDGEIQEPSWSFVVDQPVYLGASGIPTQTVPSRPGAAFLQVIGFASAADRILLNPFQPITLSE